MAVSLGMSGVVLRASQEVLGVERVKALPLDRTHALELLRPSLLDFRIIKELRALIGDKPRIPPLSDQDVLQEVARRLESREILAFRVEARSQGGGAPRGGGGGDEDDPGPQYETPVRRSASPAGPPPEPPMFPPNSDPQAQGAAAQQAAQDGLPFCEH